MKLIPGKDVTVEVGEKELYLWWHEPSLNLNWYPIIEVFHGDVSVYHREGSENPERWEEFFNDALQFVL